MLHDTGKVLLNNHSPEAYANAVARAQNEGRSLYAIEREEFGFDHTVVGGLMLKKWELPEEIVNAAVWHHSADELDMVPAILAPLLQPSRSVMTLRIRLA